MKTKEIKIPKQIIVLLIFAVILNILRIVLFGNDSFLYILWNIFLALIPYLISSILLFRIKDKKDLFKPLFIIGFIFWFLFLPNAPYVVTDFIHLGHIRSVPVMYDIFLLFVSASVALLMGLYSLVQMEKIFLLRFSKTTTNIIIAVIILFTSFGIYLGRFLRFNSWDLFVSHDSLFSGIWNVFILPNSINVYAYTLLFFSFIYVFFISFKNINIK